MTMSTDENRPQPRLRLRWRRTWPEGSPDDFTAYDGPRAYARIYRQVHAPGIGPWFWCAARDVNLGTGFAATPRQAAETAENALLGPA